MSNQSLIENKEAMKKLDMWLNMKWDYLNNKPADDSIKIEWEKECKMIEMQHWNNCNMDKCEWCVKIQDKENKLYVVD